MICGAGSVRRRTCYDRPAPSQPQRVHGGGPPLTGEDSAVPFHFDAHPRAFGSFQVRASFGDGRFGPVFLADDPSSGLEVVVRTFTHLAGGALSNGEPLTGEERDALLDALRELCERPLDHPSVARPISCGLEGDTPYFVHAFLDGIPADEYLAANGPSRLADLVPLITPAAAALDFAAAAGVTHGVLGFRDVIIGEHVAGISGFGLVQALQNAGIDISNVVSDVEGVLSVTKADIRALATITSRLLVPDDAAAIRHLVEDPPQTALGFVAAMQGVIADASMFADEPVVATSLHRADPEPPADFELRQPSFAPSFEARPESILSASATSEPARRSWIPLAVAASLAVGLVSGFAAGFVAGRRERPPAPATSSGPPPQPTATAGQIFTDQGVARQPAETQNENRKQNQFPVPGSRVPSSVVPSSEVPNAGVRGSRVPGSSTPNPSSNAERRTQSNPEPRTGNRERRNVERRTGNRERGQSPAVIPPSLWVESRPTGAAVYVDGQLVGRTPLLLGGIDPGGHSVRLDMAGYQQWMTRVTVADSGRTRVAASLEQQ